ncbi:CHAD domain-containing protein [Kitasatospora herbaricolor]|uniref:CYTH and CHAD domain-containing protein n=1 Tax=Kitasatospora herbaricolor TaxID=68217 RepID=UPI001748CAEB|nr:CYTH and CHAD domain-containing protein [Kitasatospora herbaricolor]MDQ0312633.1 CHAD domain-containing protein [Kitasatospora herbaricolor]GGV38651.1 CHAD domain-containing protein [Kitasatospora herbaricolor]
MATVHKEIERTYAGALAHPLSTERLPQVAGVRTGGTERLDAVYFDTPDLRLLRRGVTLRRRTGGHDAGWHLKTPGEDGSRTETRLPLADGSAGHPPPELLVRTALDARGRSVAPVVHLRTRRDLTLLVDEDGHTLAELARDTVSARVLDAAPPSPGPATSPDAVDWVETEVELVDGGTDLLDAVEAEFQRSGLERAARQSKLGHALAGRLPEGADAGGWARPADGDSVGGPAKSGSVGEALTGYLRVQAAALRTLDPAVRLDEPDAVHRMRVHVRRLRSALAAHRRILDRTATDPLDHELRWFGKVLGRARDTEVITERLGGQAEDLPPTGHPAETAARVRSWSGARYREAHRATVRVMHGRRYFDLLDAVDRLAARPPLKGRASRGRAEARRMLDRQRRRTARRLEQALALPPGTPRDGRLHRARKAAKRARYAAESVTPFAGRPADRLRKRARGIQQPLGAHQDGVMGEQALAEIASAGPADDRSAFGLGILYARQRADAARQVKQAAEARKRLAG